MKDDHTIIVEARIIDGDSRHSWNSHCIGPRDVADAILGHFKQAEFNGVLVESVTIRFPNGKWVELSENAF